jgi:hypothetical protein
MKDIEVKIKVNTGGAEKSIEDLTKDVQDLKKETKEVGDKGSKDVDKLGTASKKSSGLVNTLKNGFKGLGTAIKATGIGLIVAGVASLTVAASKNQKVMNAVSKVFNTISIVTSDIVTALINTVENVNKATGGFEKLGAVLGGAITIGLNTVQNGFLAIKAVVLGAQLAWEQSFLGGNDQAKILELQTSLTEVGKTIKDNITANIEAGKTIVANVGGAINEIVAIGTTAAEELSKVDLESARVRAEQMVTLKNNAQLAAAEQGKLAAKYEQEAEIQRQIRDNTTLSFKERSAASKKLEKILAKQEKALIAQADAQVAYAESQVGVNDNIENQVALTEALTNRQSVLSDITGKLSEQKTSDVGVTKEQTDAYNAQAESINKTLIESKRFNAEQLTDKIASLEALKVVQDEEQAIEEARLQRIIDNANAGTEAKIQAEIALRDKREEFRQADIQLEEQTKEEKLNKALLDTEKEEEDFLLERERLAERRRILNEDETLSAREKADKIREVNEAELVLDQKKFENKVAITNGIIGLFGAESAAGKAALIAKQILAAQELIMDIKQLSFKSTKAVAEASLANATGAAKTAAVGFPQNIPLIIGYAAQAVGIFSAIKGAVSKTKALGANVTGTSGLNSASSSPQPVQARESNFNIVGQSETNQLADVLGRREDTTVKAFVVSSELEAVASRNKEVEAESSLG